MHHGRRGHDTARLSAPSGELGLKYNGFSRKENQLGMRPAFYPTENEMESLSGLHNNFCLARVEQTAEVAISQPRRHKIYIAAKPITVT